MKGELREFVIDLFCGAGGFGGQYCRYGIETIEDCLVMCIENILI